MWKLKTKWKRNSKNYSNKWHDFKTFQNNIRKSVINQNKEYLKNLDKESYIRYMALLTLSGTSNMGTHNIPFYRPYDGNFTTIGYDFSVNKNTNIIKDYDNINIQNHYINQHWLTGLIWSDQENRKSIFKYIIKIIKEINPIKEYAPLIKSAEALVAPEISQKYTFREFNNFNEIKSAGLHNLERRVSYFNKMLNTPNSLITKNWEKKDKFQFIINGLGIYKIKVKLFPIKCGNVPYKITNNNKSKKLTNNINNKVRGRFEVISQFKSQKNLISCNNGFFKINEFYVERNDIEIPNINNNMVDRNSLGGILVNIKKGNNIKIKSIIITSEQTNKIVPISSSWPFQIELLEQNIIQLGIDDSLLEYSKNLKQWSFF